jgi:hypothetical protein
MHTTMHTTYQTVATINLPRGASARVELSPRGYYTTKATFHPDDADMVLKVGNRAECLWAMRHHPAVTGFIAANTH